MDVERSLYGREYFAARQDVRRLISYQQDAEKIYRRKPGYRTVLDIGSGTGEFSDYLTGDYYGYDPFTAHKALPNAMFDVVIFRGTLQHIYNPVVMLVEARNRLHPGGLLAILATPDTDSIGYLRWGTLPALDPERNWIPFGHRMLVNILERLGFCEIEVRHPYGKPYASPLKNLWNFVVGKPDAFPGNMMEVFCVAV